MVAGGCLGVFIPCVHDSVSFLFGKFLNVTIWFSVTVIVFPHHLVSKFFINMYHSVVPYECVNRSYRSLGKGPLLLRHGYRSSPALEAWVFVGGRSRACWSCWQEGEEMFSSCLQDWVSFFVVKSIHVTICFVCNRQCISLSLGYGIFQLYHGLMPYVCVSSSYRRVSRPHFIYAMDNVPPQH